jgi:alpha/beta superfamily hydrolase
MKTAAVLPAPGQTQRVLIPGPAGKLEGLTSTPAQAQPQPVAALVCHPHPQFGGTMDNKVVYTLAKACTDVGCVALRFNFRGVGASEGSFDAARGETDDALAALDWLCAATGARRFVLCGFSFGAFVALNVAMQRTPAQLVSIAPPLGYFGAAPVPRPDCPWLVVHGDADDVVDCAQTAALLRAMQPPVDLHVLPGVGHFFHGRLGELRSIVVSALTRSLSQA